MNISRSRWPRRLMWISAAATAAAVLLDRIVVMLVDTFGPGIAVPGGELGDADLTDRTGDFIDIGLVVITVALVGMTWAIHRAGGGRAVLAGIVVAIGPALLIGACFFTPLFFSLTAQAGRNELTFGQATGPYWYLVTRPAALGIAAGCLSLAVAFRALARTPPGPAAPKPRAASWMTTGLAVTACAVTSLLGLHVWVAVLAGMSPLGVLLPVVGVVPALVASLAIVTATVRGGLARADLVPVGTGANAVLWIAAATWLLLENPLVVEPSPMDDAARQAIEPWAGPLLLIAVGLTVAAQTVVLLVMSRRDVSAWLRRGQAGQQAMASPLEG